MTPSTSLRVNEWRESKKRIPACGRQASPPFAPILCSPLTACQCATGFGMTSLRNGLNARGAGGWTTILLLGQLGATFFG